MRLLEHEAKTLLREYAVPTPRGFIVSRAGPRDAMRNANLPLPWYVKAQVPVGGRGKSGGILVASSRAEAEQQAARLLSGDIRGYPVEAVLMEEAVAGIRRELFLAITVDRSARSYVLIAGSVGGMDVEEIARSRPETVLRIKLSPLRALDSSDVLAVSDHLGIPAAQVGPIASALCRMTELDAELVEINPLAESAGGALIALDAKVEIDDNALFRQERFRSLPPRGLIGEEAYTAGLGLSYVRLEGEVGIISNGAGLTMATMDLVRFKGGRPANFLDLGGGAEAGKFEAGMRLLLGQERVRAVLVNIFGGITRCDEVARGIVSAVGRAPVKPVVIRLAGTNEEEGRRILEEAGMTAYSDPVEAAGAAANLAGASHDR